MASILPDVEKKQTLADASLLDDKLPDWCKTTWAVTAYTVVLGAIFALVSYLPLWHTDLWGHLAYGRFIVENGLPATEPLLPMADGVRFVGTAWLSQVIGYGLYESMGPVGLRFLHALCVTFCLALIARRLHSKTGRFAPTLAGLVAMGWLWSDALRVMRPQVAGIVMFTLVFFLLTGKWRKAYWGVIPALFALWANLHGSFVVGLALMGAFWIGRGVDVFRKAPLGKGWRMMFVDPVFRRLFLLTEFAALAALLNPYGLELYLAVFSLSQNPNVHALSEWEPLTLRILPGWGFAVCGIALAALYRLSPRRVTATELIVMLGLGLGTLWTYRFIVWFAPVVAYWIALHAAAAFRRKEPSEAVAGSKWPVISLGLIWIFFAYTPMGVYTVHGTQSKLEKQVSPLTPIGAADYLRENPVPGQIFTAPIAYGDYLLWANPQTTRTMSTSHVHLTPERIWNHQLRMQGVAGNWRGLLDWYGINAVVLVKDAPGAPLRAGLQKDEFNWRVGYEDDVAIVFERVKPIVTGVDLRKRAEK